MHQIPDVRSVVLWPCCSWFSCFIFTPRAQSPAHIPTHLSVTCSTARNGNLGAQEPGNKTGFTSTCSITPSPLLHLPLSFLLAFSPSPSPLLRRLLYPPGILCIFGSAVGLLECARGSESLLHTSDDEHVV